GDAGQVVRAGVGELELHQALAQEVLRPGVVVVRLGHRLQVRVEAARRLLVVGGEVEGEALVEDLGAHLLRQRGRGGGRGRAPVGAGRRRAGVGSGGGRSGG